MGTRNYLIEGVSGTGKTSVCRELRRRGHHAVNGDTDLAYQGDPATGEPLDGHTQEHHVWDGGGCGRSPPTGPGERTLIERLHRTGEDLPRDGIVIDATAPLSRVVDEILRQSARPS
ncbi:MAG TPA: hypothetical protein VGK18_03695 [Propionicimonas sp.]|uniref:hypothetical protein n=1 Tax=Propionicimonas sp. TaxID=1955623 RepID=UPI002F42CEB7